MIKKPILLALALLLLLAVHAAISSANPTMLANLAGNGGETDVNSNDLNCDQDDSTSEGTKSGSLSITNNSSLTGDGLSETSVTITGADGGDILWSSNDPNASHATTFTAGNGVNIATYYSNNASSCNSNGMNGSTASNSSHIVVTNSGGYSNYNPGSDSYTPSTTRPTSCSQNQDSQTTRRNTVSRTYSCGPNHSCSSGSSEVNVSVKSSVTCNGATSTAISGSSIVNSHKVATSSNGSAYASYGGNVETHALDGQVCVNGRIVDLKDLDDLKATLGDKITK
ncbi:MAG TPA: hypothetical protein VGK02_10870 [Candidatus Aquicultor sp.]